MSFFHNLNKTLDSIAARPESAPLNERDMGKHNNATTGFAALARKAGGGEKGEKIAGAQFQKMKKAGQLEEEGMSRAARGYEKYGKQGMEALAKAGRDDASANTMDAIRNRYDKYDNEEVDEGMGMTDEGNAFSKAVVDAKKDGIQPGEKIRVGGKEYPVKEAAKYRDPKYKDKLYTQQPPDYTYGPDMDDAYDNPKPDDYAGRKRKTGGSEFDHNDPLKRGQGIGRSGIKNNMLDRGPRKGLPSRDQITSLKGSIKDASGTHARPNLPEADVPMSTKQKSFAALAPPADKITFADKIAGAKKEVDEMLGDVAAEAMRSALGGGRGRNAEMDEASDDNAFTAHKRARAETPKVGTITHGSKHDVEEIPGGRRVTRRTDAQGISVGADDGQSSGDEPRGRGRPKGPAKAPERVTGGATKHRGGRKMTKEGDIDIADQGEYDQEGDMAKDTIKTVVRHAQALEKILGDNDNLPEWVQSKLAKIEGMMTAVDDYMQNQESDQDDEMAMGEEKTSTRDNRAERAGKRVAKDIEYDEKKKDGIHGSRRGSEDNKADKAGKKVTKDIEHDEKEDDEKEDEPKKSKSKFKFGGSVYEQLDTKLETLINESMNISVNMATTDDGQQDSNSITVTASGEDAMTLAQLLKSAGLSQSSHSGCSVCGQSSCGCEQVDENSPDYPTNTETSNNAFQYAGGLNKPKSTGQTTTPVLASQLRRQVSMEESVKIERNLFDLYKNFTK